MRSSDPAVESDAVLDVRDLTKAYGGRPVLSGVTFRVGAGSIVAVTGTNGAGKSTLLRAVAGLARSEGTIRVCGRPLSDPAARRRIAYLPQTTDLPGWATVGEVLDLFAGLRNPAPRRRSRSPEPPAAPAVTLPEGFVPDTGARVGTLSGGQQRRVALAGVLLGRPDLLLLDEPAANLDDRGTAELGAVLEHLRASGSSLLVATPSATDVSGLADRLLVLVDGWLALDEPSDGVRPAPLQPSFVHHPAMLVRETVA